jgi:hypothetical protein
MSRQSNYSYDGSGLYADAYGQPTHIGSWQDYARRVRTLSNKPIPTNRIKSVAKSLNLPPYHTFAQSKSKYGMPYINAQKAYDMERRKQAQLMLPEYKLPQIEQQPFSFPIAHPEYSMPPISFPIVPFQSPNIFSPDYRIQGKYGESQRKVELMNQLYALRRQPPCTYTQKSLRSMTDEQLADLWKQYNPHPIVKSHMA